MGVEFRGKNGMKHELVLLRHGKSAYPHGVADVNRPLAPRGHRQARLAGEWIDKHVGAFDLILCSTAKRARETLEAADLKGPVTHLDELYNTAHLAYLETIISYGVGVHKLAVVGHHPAISATALALAKNRDSAPARQMERKYPTSGVALLTSPNKFSELETGHFTLEHFHVPGR